MVETMTCKTLKAFMFARSTPNSPLLVYDLTGKVTTIARAVVREGKLVLIYQQQAAPIQNRRVQVTLLSTPESSKVYYIAVDGSEQPCWPGRKGLTTFNLNGY